MAEARRRLRIALALGIGTLAALVSVELGARVVLLARGAAYDADATESRLTALAQGMRAFLPQDAIAERLASGAPLPELALLQHPYTGFDVYKGFAQFKQDVAYFAQPPTAAGGPAATVDVLILGGSVAAQFCDSPRGADKLVAALRALPELAGRELRVLPYARMGFRQPQSCTQLAFLFAAGFAPDAVVLLDGFNDVALGNNNARNGVSPLFPSTSHWGFLLRNPLSKEGALPLFLRAAEANQEAEAIASAALARGDEHSALLGSWALSRALAARTRAYEAQQAFEELAKSGSRSAAETGLGFDGDASAAVDAAVRCWRESSRSMRALCEARGIAYVHALQPALHDPDGGKQPTADEQQAGAIDDYWREGVVLGYPRLRAALAQLQQGGERALDLSGVFRGLGESVYTDYCHLNGSGNELVAERIAPELGAALVPRAAPTR
jgi:lysophospholipase L1-like esterase